MHFTMRKEKIILIIFAEWLEKKEGTFKVLHKTSHNSVQKVSLTGRRCKICVMHFVYYENTLCQSRDLWCLTDLESQAS